jgi:membrane-bound inhibitor of C-type lysozyme
MRVAPLIVVFSGGLLAAVAASADPAQPPMGQFDGAYYTCDQGQAFQISYDSRKAKKATLTTSNNNHRYKLDRVNGAAGPRFSNGSVNISVVGEGAQVQGTVIPLTGCKLKNTT